MIYVDFSPFHGEAPVYIAARGSTPPRCPPQALLSPSPWFMEEGDPARQQQQQQQHNNDTMASPRGPSPIIAPRELQLIRSGIPLSLMITSIGRERSEIRTGYCQ